MLACIPAKPEYDLWLRISSAVFSALPMEPACRVLNAWSPEEREGEYASKHKARLSQVTTGTLIHVAKQHGWKGNRSGGRVKVATPSSLTAGVRQALASAPRPSWLPEKLTPISNRRLHPSPPSKRNPAPPACLPVSPCPPVRLFLPSDPTAAKPAPKRALVPAGRCPHCWHHWGRCLIDGHCICTGDVSIRPNPSLHPIKKTHSSGILSARNTTPEIIL